MTRPAEDIRNKILARHPNATVIDRGPTWIRHHLEGQAYNWTGTLGKIHFGPAPFGEDSEIDTAWIPGELQDQPWLWKMTKADYHVFFAPGVDAFDAGQIIKYVHPATQQDVTFQPLQLQWTNDLDQIEPIGDPQPTGPTIADDTLTFLSAFGPDLNFQWHAQTQRLAKTLIIASPGAIGSPPAWMDPAGLSLKLQFIFQISNDVDVYVDGQLWNKNTRTETYDLVEFQVDGQPLWYFKSPAAVDVSSEASCSQVLRKSGPNLIVEVRVPWSWLQTATYPVEVDPSVQEQVGASSDDAGEDDSTGWVVLTNVYLPVDGGTKWIGFRFTTVAIEGTIDGATMDVYVANAANDDPILDIYGNDVDDAVTFSTSSYNLSGRDLTTASVNWNASSVGSGFVTTPEIKTVIQEIVDRGGWASGQDIAILFDGLTSSKLVCRSWDSDTSYGAYLDVDYTSGEAEAASLLALLGVGG